MEKYQHRYRSGAVPAAAAFTRLRLAGLSFGKGGLVPLRFSEEFIAIGAGAKFAANEGDFR